MPESEHHRRLITSTPRLTRDEIVGQAFPQAFRGISEPAVRAFLRRLADDYEAMRVQIEELQRDLDDLAEQVDHQPQVAPAPRDENDLIAALGEETARVLRSAKESADEIRANADHKAQEALHSAQEEARRVREEAEHAAAERTREADEASAEMIREAERLARELQEGAEVRVAEFEAKAQAEATAELESARRRAKELVAEAQASRDRSLQEMARRREALETQLETLRAGRDRLLEAYRVVRQSFEDATDALKSSEARVPTERSRARVTSPALPVQPVVRAAEVAAPPVVPEIEEREERDDAERDARAEDDGAPSASEAADVRDDAAEAEPAAAGGRGPARVGSITLGELPTRPDDAPDGDAGDEAEAPAPDADADDESPPVAGEDATSESEDAVAGAAASADEGGGPSPDSVDAIFARLRAGTGSEGEGEEGEEASEAEPAAGVEAETDEKPADGEGGPADGAVAHDHDHDASDALLLDRRDAVLDRHAADLVKGVKRVIRDEQNLVLEAVRRHKRGVPSADDVVPTLQEQEAAFVEATAATLSAACADGEAAARELGAPGNGNGSDRAPRARELAASLARTLMDPLRGRLADALREAAAIEDSDVEERVRSRYREWKGRRIDDAVHDALAAAFVRGVYDAVPAGMKLRWVVSGVTPCADCADNVLEPADRGAEFPTGHRLPPVHPGCHCVVLPDAAVAG